MARKRPAASRRARPKPPRKPKPPEGWIRIIFGQSVHPKLAAPGERNLRLSLQAGKGRVRSITLTYEQTKKLLGK
jgi:hypothetical protein